MTIPTLIQACINALEYRSAPLATFTLFSLLQNHYWNQPVIKKGKQIQNKVSKNITVGLLHPFFEQPRPDLGKAESLDPKEAFMLIWSVSLKSQILVEAR